MSYINELEVAVWAMQCRNIFWSNNCGYANLTPCQSLSIRCSCSGWNLKYFDKILTKSKH